MSITLPNKPKSNTNLKKLEIDANAIRRSASISNLGGGNQPPNKNNNQNNQHQQQDMIVSPNLVKPSLSTTTTTTTAVNGNSTTTNGNSNNYQHQRNNSTNNLYPIQAHNRKTSLMNELKGRISSISDENIAGNVTNPPKFKLTNVSKFKILI